MDSVATSVEASAEVQRSATVAARVEGLVKRYGEQRVLCGIYQVVPDPSPSHGRRR